MFILITVGLHDGLSKGNDTTYRDINLPDRVLECGETVVVIGIEISGQLWFN